MPEDDLARFMKEIIMSFDPKQTPGIGQLYLVSMNSSEELRKELDKLFENVDGLSRVYCAVRDELIDAYRIWNIYGTSYASDIDYLAGREREERIDLLALWTEVLTLRTVRLTDKSKRHEPVSVFQFLSLNLDADLKKKVKGLAEITENKSEPLRKARDKFFAHKDFDVVDGKINLEFTIYDIADILESIGDILRCIRDHYAKDDTHVSFELEYSPLRKVKY